MLRRSAEAFLVDSNDGRYSRRMARDDENVSKDVCFDARHQPVAPPSTEWTTSMRSMSHRTLFVLFTSTTTGSVRRRKRTFMAMSLRKGLTIVQSLIFLAVVCLFGLGIYGYLYRHDTNFCGTYSCFSSNRTSYLVPSEMTYMFENPTYNRIAMSEDIEQRYPRYGLYSYCEGVQCEVHRKNRFSGQTNNEALKCNEEFRCHFRSTGSVHCR